MNYLLKLKSLPENPAYDCVFSGSPGEIFETSKSTPPLGGRTLPHVLQMDIRLRDIDDRKSEMLPPWKQPKVEIDLSLTKFKKVTSRSKDGSSQKYSTPSSYKPLKRINVKRTHAQVAQALRPKQNFLHFELVNKHRKSVLQQGTSAVSEETDVKAPRDFRFVMPEFMPKPDWKYRDHVFEKLERQDMLRRRRVIDVPEFYVGTILAVTVSDPHSPDKKNRFVGICIDRRGHGLNASFILRNAVDGLGVEVMYEIYDPSLQSIEVLKLEKRLDDQLYYLRNAPIEYSTFNFDLEPVPLPRGAEVPVNTIKVPLNPKPWEMRWERMELKGIVPLELTRKQIKGIEKTAKPWEEHDIMLDYRSKVNEDEEEAIMAEVYKEKEAIDFLHKSSKAVFKRRRR